jgi:hypothetical protein
MAKLRPEEGSSKVLWNVGILSHHYMAPQPRRPRLGSKASLWRWKEQGPPKRWYSTISLYGTTAQKTTIIALKISNFTYNMLISRRQLSNIGTFLECSYITRISKCRFMFNPGRDNWMPRAKTEWRLAYWSSRRQWQKFFTCSASPSYHCSGNPLDLN